MNHPVYWTDLKGTHTLERRFTCTDPLHETRFIVPVGFKWDGPSIPRVLWSPFPPHFLSGGPALIHDLLYRTGGSARGHVVPFRKYTRAEADGLFLFHMWDEGVVWHRRYLAYLAVRLFGGKAWKV